MQQYGYNPLAGGLLTGKYKGMDDPALDERGRFSSEYAGTKENPNPSYRGRYFKPAVFDAIGAHWCQLCVLRDRKNPALLTNSYGNYYGRRGAQRCL